MKPFVEPNQFVILGTVVAMAAYVGTVAREVARKIGEELKNDAKHKPGRRPALTALIVADFLLISLAFMVGLRIQIFASGHVVLGWFDELIVRVIGVTVFYMILLHIAQWSTWIRRIRQPAATK